jgi:WD40 repeat protein
MSDQVPDFNPDARPPRPLPSWPWLTMLLNFILIATIFVTREKWEPWQLQKEVGIKDKYSRLYLRDDGRVVLCCKLFTVHAMDLNTGALLWKIKHSELTLARGVREIIAREYVELPEGGVDFKAGVFRVIDVGTGAIRFTLVADESKTLRQNLIPDKGLIIAEYDDGSTRVWDIVTGEIVPTSEDELVLLWATKYERMGSMNFPSDGRGIVRVWRSGFKPQKVAFSLEAFEETWGASASRVLEDRRRILVRGRTDQDSGIWDMSTGALLARIPGSSCDVAGDFLCTFDRDRLLVYRRVRPEWWWGVFWLPHFWGIVVLGVCVFASGWRDVLRMRQHEREASPSSGRSLRAPRPLR